MANVLSADFSRFLADLAQRLSPTDRMELIAAVDDIDGGTADDPIDSVHDERVDKKPRLAINRLIQNYSFYTSAAA